MADDIDDLLNEVEDKYISKSKTANKSKSVGPWPTSKVSGSGSSSSMRPKQSNLHDNFKSTDTQHHRNQSKSELDDLINDVLDDISVKDTSKVLVRNHCTSSKNTLSSGTSLSESMGAGSQMKCFPVWLGGSAFPEGLATAVHQRCCDELRCTDCDFHISTFDNFQWHSSTDYLHLRNNMPDFHRLKSKLISSKGYRAYACQCKWKSAKELVNLDTQRDVKWVCGKH